MKLVFAFITLCCAFYSAAAQYQAHQLDSNSLQIDTDVGKVSLTFYQSEVVEAFYQPDGVKQLPSFSISQQPGAVALTLAETDNSLTLSSASLTLKINKAPLQIRYYRAETLLLAEANNMVSMRALNRWVSISSVQAWNEAWTGRLRRCKRWSSSSTGTLSRCVSLVMFGCRCGCLNPSFW